MKLPDGRDGNFVCGGCGGDIVVEKTLKNGRKVFKCNKCSQHNLLECVICNLPKTVWADSGTICVKCYSDYSSGKITLTEEQEKGIAEWMVVIPSKI